jgi:hypothetical protein
MLQWPQGIEHLPRVTGTRELYMILSDDWTSVDASVDIVHRHSENFLVGRDGLLDSAKPWKQWEQRRMYVDNSTGERVQEGLAE